MRPACAIQRVPVRRGYRMRPCVTKQTNKKNPNSLTAKHKRINEYIANTGHFHSTGLTPQGELLLVHPSRYCPSRYYKPILDMGKNFFYLFRKDLWQQKTKTDQSKRTQLLKRRYKKYCVQQPNRKPQSGRTISHTSPGETAVQLRQMLPIAGSILNTLGFSCYLFVLKASEIKAWGQLIVSSCRFLAEVNAWRPL